MGGDLIFQTSAKREKIEVNSGKKRGGPVVKRGAGVGESPVARLLK